MATVYQIIHTDGARTITIQPGTLNGPGGVLTNTDLSLYGQGTLQWGQGVDQNLLRLLENFACSESILTPGSPMNAAELGIPLAGINNPVLGQHWFNTDDLKVYVYGGTTWGLVGGVSTGIAAPVAPGIGDLWYDTAVPQLKIYNGVSFISVSDRYLLLDGGSLSSGAYIVFSGGGEVLGLPATPSVGDAAASKTYVDAQISGLSISATNDFVNATGDTMTGSLQIRTNDPSLNLQRLSDSSTRARINLNVGSDEFRIQKMNGGTVQNSLTIASNKIVTDPSNGKIETPLTNVLDSSSTVVTKSYVDGLSSGYTTQFVNATGDTMTGFLSLNSNPTANLHAATKQYVDSQIVGVSDDGVAIAWLVYNGVTGAIIRQYNITSVSKLSAGNYSVTMATSAGSTAYCIVLSNVDDGTDTQAPVFGGLGNPINLNVVTGRAAPTSATTFTITIKNTDGITVTSGGNDLTFSPAISKARIDNDYITVAVYDN